MTPIWESIHGSLSDRISINGWIRSTTRLCRETGLFPCRTGNGGRNDPREPFYQDPPPYHYPVRHHCDRHVHSSGLEPVSKPYPRVSKQRRRDCKEHRPIERGTVA